MSDWSFISITIPPDRLDEAIAHPDALKIAYDVGVLELIGLGLSLLGVALVVIGFAAYFSVQRSAKLGSGPRDGTWRIRDVRRTVSP